MQKPTKFTLLSKWQTLHEQNFEKFKFGPSKYYQVLIILGFPGGSDGKESTHNAGDLGSFHPWAGKIPWKRAW